MSDDFSTVEAEFWKQFGKGLEIALATVDGDGVAARTVAAVPLNGKVYFSTTEDSAKAVQIGKNPAVALCLGATQVRGTAKAVGGVGEGKNKAIVAAIITAFGKGIESYFQLPGMVVFEIVPAWGGFGRMNGEELVEVDFTARTTRSMKM